MPTVCVRSCVADTEVRLCVASNSIRSCLQHSVSTFVKKRLLHLSVVKSLQLEENQAHLRAPTSEAAADSGPCGCDCLLYMAAEAKDALHF